MGVMPRRWLRSRPVARTDAAIERARAEAAAEVEQHDIDDMLTAIGEYRRRRGARTVGEELADDLERGTWQP